MLTVNDDDHLVAGWCQRTTATGSPAVLLPLFSEPIPKWLARIRCSAKTAFRLFGFGHVSKTATSFNGPAFSEHQLECSLEPLQVHGRCADVGERRVPASEKTGLIRRRDVWTRVQSARNFFSVGMFWTRVQNIPT
jgi:hypothetical protein